MFSSNGLLCKWVLHQTRNYARQTGSVEKIYWDCEQRENMMKYREGGTLAIEMVILLEKQKRRICKR